ncbi:unnamed protein product [Thlaspi arvense]|uniref:Uncharacterized protein n=1 Tax=Thlaspi arvense TaxID=13288 RepID=A0AAU9R9N8_THLAR|nr:unnamed protein product [Thlaspi arvense]
MTYVTLSNALHALLITAILLALIFVELAGNRDDNDTLPVASPAPSQKTQKTTRPDFRLLLFGGLFVGYLVTKVWEMTITRDSLAYKKFWDDVSLLIGCASLVAAVYIIAIKFTYCVLAPAYGAVVMGWGLSRCGLLKWFHIPIQAHTIKQREFDESLRNADPLLPIRDYEAAIVIIDSKKEKLDEASEKALIFKSRMDDCLKEWDRMISNVRKGRATETTTILPVTTVTDPESICLVVASNTSVWRMPIRFLPSLTRNQEGFHQLLDGHHDR